MAEEEAALDTLEGEGEGEEDPVRSTTAQHHRRRQNLVTPGQGETRTNSLRNNKQKADRAASASIAEPSASVCSPNLGLHGKKRFICELISIVC